MIAADTNVVVRFIARDDARQSAVARALLAERGFYVSNGVLMETEWVLRSTLRWPRARANEALVNFVSLAAVTVDDLAAIRWALGRHAGGADFADMLHLIAATQNGSFATFDVGLSAQAGLGAPVKVETLR